MDEASLIALLSSLRWCRAVLATGPSSAHRPTAVVVATVCLRALRDGFPVVAVDGHLATLPWLRGDVEANATLLWDVDKAVVDLVSVCCDDVGLTALRNECVVVWGRVFPYSHASVSSKRAMLSSLTQPSASPFSPAVASTLLTAALQSISLSNGAVEILSTGSDPETEEGKVDDEGTYRTRVQLRRNSRFPTLPPSARVCDFYAPLSLYVAATGYEESKGEDVDAPVGIAMIGRRGSGSARRSSRGLLSTSGLPPIGAPVTTPARPASLLNRLLSKFSSHSGGATAALRASAALVLARMQSEISESAVPATSVPSTMINPTQYASRAAGISPAVSWNYNAIADCLAFMVRLGDAGPGVCPLVIARLNC